jgi:uncharacterized LabA/DUF88 family protein
MPRKIKKVKKEMVYAFIDSQNINLGVRSRGWTLDFGKFRTYIKDKYNVEKAFLFIGYISDNQKLYTYLQKAGYIVIFKPVLEYSSHKKVKVKGNVDAELVLHCMVEYENYDKAIVVSGDGDFYCLVEYLEEKGKLKKIVVPNKKYSSLLRKYASFIVNVGLFRRKVEEK